MPRGGTAGGTEIQSGGIVPLTDTQCRKAKPAEKDYKLADSAGLYLFVTTRGAKSWRTKYRLGGKERCIVFGRYPEIGLAKVRELRDRARAELRDHKDPQVEEHKREMAAQSAAGSTFEVVAKRCHEAQLGRWSVVQATKVRQALERDVYPVIGRLPLPDITSGMVLDMLRRAERRSAIDTAKRIRYHVSAVFAFAIPEGLCTADPAGPALVTSYSIGAAARGHGVLIFSLEMSADELTRRILADMTFSPRGGVPYEHVRDGTVRAHEMDAVHPPGAAPQTSAGGSGR